MFSDTPLPPEEPAGQNPPDGAILDYYLPPKAQQVQLEIFDAQQKLVRSFSSKDLPTVIDPATVPYPLHWVRPAQGLSTEPGHRRFVWDLRYPAPRGAERSLSIAAVTSNTAMEPRGPFVSPGKYRVRLTVDGVRQEQDLDIRMDPRVSASAEDIRLQQEYSMRCYLAYEMLQDKLDSVDRLIKDPAKTWSTAEKAKWILLRGEGTPGYGDILYGSIRETAPDKETITGLQDKLLYMLSVLQSADARPTGQSMEAVEKLERRSAELTLRIGGLSK
jgi:hypothetical protein